jgi:hypothetical protein
VRNCTLERGRSATDWAIKLEDKMRLLIEIKAIGIELRDQHVKPAVESTAN